MKRVETNIQRVDYVFSKDEVIKALRRHEWYVVGDPKSVTFTADGEVTFHYEFADEVKP